MKWHQTEQGKKRLKENSTNYYELHKEEYIEKVIKRQREIKFQILDCLGWKCACCGVTEWWNLTLDHIKPTFDAKTRSRVTKKILNHILNHPEEYQTLCWGCNNSKSNRERCTIDHKNRQV